MIPFHYEYEPRGKTSEEATTSSSDIQGSTEFTSVFHPFYRSCVYQDGASIFQLH